MSLLLIARCSILGLPCEVLSNRELMSESTTLGTWLRRERERRGVTLGQISEQTKVSVSLLQGLEGDDLSRWPGGIYRRSFARSYATAIGVDPDLVVRRLAEEHPDPDAQPADAAVPVPSGAAVTPQVTSTPQRPEGGRWRSMPPGVRVKAVLLDLLMACAIALGFAAAGTGLLWPVMVLAAYHAAGLFLTGTTPMAALLATERTVEAAPASPAVPATETGELRRAF